MREIQSNSVRGSRGMSLVELLLVMAILSVVMMAVISLYVPAHQSTVAQTQVSDVQSNLRLALDRMTQDLLIAGFLVPLNPIIFEDSITPTTADNPDADDFTIRTRAVGNAFARVGSAANVSGKIEITVANAAMADLFPAGSQVRLFEPLTALEVKAGEGTNAERVYNVESSGAGKITISPGTMSTIADDVPVETVVLKVRDSAQPPLQTIRYRIEDGALTRTVNGQRQYLARNVESVVFGYDKTPEGRVRRVDITLTGATKALKNDAISGKKSRQVETSVSLRNIY